MSSGRLRIKVSRYMFLLFISLFILCVLFQFLSVGLAMFVDSGNWVYHRNVVHLFGWNIPLLLLLFAYLGSLPRLMYGHIFGLFFFIFAMYFTANMRFQIPWIGALHPLFGLLLLAISCRSLKSIIKMIFSKNEQQEGV
ncbi:DUF6220 domain-containing protein [Halalkalibacter okhensis]|uniref:DUF6220 domain-containing protein n=1 Tax=Halalkalibacter okhensis TaxID=333138 RepID=UPI00068F7857|nr:DUF6220 domain-containing protein [Halalkalibacter okhensis]